jgi:hypothetical protein
LSVLEVITRREGVGSVLGVHGAGSVHGLLPKEGLKRKRGALAFGSFAGLKPAAR